MENIQVSLENGTVLGNGQGTIDARNGTAAIQSWDKSAGLQVGKTYSLKAHSKKYTATCTGAHPGTQPVATFNNVA